MFFQAVQNYVNNPRKYEVTRDIGELLESSKEADTINLRLEEEEETDLEFIESDPESDSDELAAIREGEETHSEVSSVGLRNVDISLTRTRRRRNRKQSAQTVKLAQ